MAVMSFAHLRNRGAAQDNMDAKIKDRLTEPAVPAEKPTPEKEQPRLPLCSFHFDPDFEEVELTADLMESRFCFGCRNFSIDAPGTEVEIGWSV